MTTRNNDNPISTPDTNPYQTPQSESDHFSDLSEYCNIDYLGARGRIGRVRTLLFGISQLMIVFIGGGLINALLSIVFVQLPSSNNYMVVAMAVGLMMYVGMFYVLFSNSIRRLHDLDYSGWFSLFLLVPVINIILALILLLWPGSRDRNRFGAPPPQNKIWMLPVALILLTLPILLVVSVVNTYNDYRARAEQYQSH